MKKKSYGTLVKLFLFAIIIVSLISIMANLFLYLNYLSFFKVISGHAGNQGFINFSVEGDTIFPAVSVVFPENTTYSSHATELNYTASDEEGLSACWYSLNNGQANTSITCGDNATGLNSSEGSNKWSVYVNDTSNNKNSSSVVFEVSLPSASPGGGGGGGGGGSPSVKTEDFELNPEELNIFIVSEEQESREIKVKNIGKRKLTIDISVTGISEMVSSNVNNLILKPGEEGNVLLTITAPGSGIFAGRIVFNSDNLRRDVLVIVNVQSDDALFDVSLTIPSTYRFVLPGGNIKAFISLLQIVAVQEVDVNVNYLVKDFEGNVYLQESETFFVFRSKSFVKEFITENLPAGDYIVGIEVTYPGGFASASNLFTISDEVPLFSPVAKSILLILLLIILLSLAIIFAILKYKKSKRHLRLGRTRGKK